MISPAEFDKAATAREGLERARTLLLAPTLDALLEAGPVLERSAAALSDLETTVRAPGETAPGARESLARELMALRRVLTGVQRLMTNAAAFHRGWASLVGLESSDYTHTGALVHRPAEVRSMVIRG